MYTLSYTHITTFTFITATAIITQAPDEDAAVAAGWRLLAAEGGKWFGSIHFSAVQCASVRMLAALISVQCN